jgi:hypothetical protein
MTGQYSTFVVRLWCDEHGKLLRGQIEHTISHEHSYFDKFEDMNKFMTKYLGYSQGNLELP